MHVRGSTLCWSIWLDFILNAAKCAHILVHTCVHRAYVPQFFLLLLAQRLRFWALPSVKRNVGLMILVLFG